MSGRYSAYPAYEPSKAEWQDDVPKGWSSLALGRMFRRVKRSGFSDEELLSVYRDYGVIPKESRDDNFNKASEDLSPYQLVRAGDLVMNKMKAWQGSIAMSEHRGIVSPAYFVYEAWRSKDERMASKYIHYLLRSPAYITQYLSRSKGIRVNQWDLDPGAFEKIEVLLPSLEEQIQIANFLDYETAKIDALIEKQQQLIALLKEKRQAVISHAVTKGLNPDAPLCHSGVEWLGEVPGHWEILNLNRVVKTFVDYRGRTPDKVDEGRPLVTAGAVRNGIIDLERAPQFVAEETYHMLRQRGLPEVGDLLFTSEAPLGEVAIVEDVEFACAQRIIMFKLNRSKMQPRFMWLYLRAQAGQDEIQTKASGSTAEGIRADRLRRCRVLVPPLEEQAEIAAHVEIELCGFDEILRIAADQTELLQERRTALISAAVTGKIDVRGWKPPESKPQTEAA